MPLWAKRPIAGSAPTVFEHCRDVRDAAASLYEVVGLELKKALGPAEAIGTELRQQLLAAALLHDFAKVNSAFQAILQAAVGEMKRQPVRHEILAALLLTDTAFLGQWFASLGAPETIWPILWAVAGHHLKMGDPADPTHRAKLFYLSDAKLDVPLSDGQVGVLLREVANVLGRCGGPETLHDLKFDPTDDDESGLESRIADFAERSCRIWQRLRKNEDVVRRTAILKGFLISSDAAASALTSDGTNPPEWIRAALAKRIDPSGMDPVIVEGLDGKPERTFQICVGASCSLATVVIAGCGNGKTTAAYMWAKRHAAARKLFFTYPTTGTASAGFEDYIFDQKKLASDLIHGRAGVDLQAMRGTGEAESDDAIRIDSLRAWDRQVIVCTVDTVLGLLQNQRRPLYSFPAIIAGAFVFDEIHSYDARLFGGLLRFLKTFPGLPVLLMSASIPPARMNALKEALGGRIGDVIRGDPVIEGYMRYRLHKRETVAACRDDVGKLLCANKKVLWVCNTVGEAIKLAREASDWAGVEPLIYHSRLRYRDRVNRQKELIARFNTSGPVLAITTQVCEMSLDISADLMVTAECPLPSLVQRLGRLNRYAGKDDPWPCLVYPFRGMPYNEESAFVQIRGDCIASMKACRTAVAELDEKACSQLDLAERLDHMDETEQFEEYSAWLDDGWITEPAQVRDGDESITLIREEDLTAIENEFGPRKKWTHGKLVPWTIPMLFRKDFIPTDKVGGYPVAAKGVVNYCEKEGATWVSERL